MPLKSLKVTLLCAGLILANQSFAQTATPNNNINSLVSTFMATGNVPGVALAIYDHGKQYFYNYGVADTSSNQAVTSNTIFELGSVTKVFTATLLAEEIQAGKMSLQDPVVNYLPANVKSSHGAINQVTLQELATHTASLPSVPPGLALKDRPNYSKADLMNYVSSWQPETPIGSNYAYSNIGFGLLGYALEGATGESYNQLLQEDIFSPLNMQSSSLNSPVDDSRYAQGYNNMGNAAMHWPMNAWPAGGAIRSTATDMMNFLEANLGVATSSASTSLLQAMRYAHQGLFNTGNFNQGLAWAVMPNGIIKKDGATAGFSTFIALWPEKQMGVVVLTNKSGVPVGKLATQILQMLAQGN